MHRSSEVPHSTSNFLRLAGILNVKNIAAHRRTLIIEAIPTANPTNILTINYVSYTMSFATVPETPIGPALAEDVFPMSDSIFDHLQKIGNT